MDLVDFEISRYVEKEIMGISPYDPSNIQPNSYDVHLGNQFILFSQRVPGRSGALIPAPIEPVDMRNPSALKELRDSGWVKEFTSPSVVLMPDEFLLATTVEVITLPDFIRAQIDGKSSLARWGITIHQTGGYIDAGFSGEITLEITNAFPLPIRLWAGDPIAQISFTQHLPCHVPYNLKKGAKYGGQSGPTPSMYYKNFSGGK